MADSQKNKKENEEGNVAGEEISRKKDLMKEEENGEEETTKPKKETFNNAKNLPTDVFEQERKVMGLEKEVLSQEIFREIFKDDLIADNVDKGSRKKRAPLSHWRALEKALDEDEKMTLEEDENMAWDEVEKMALEEDEKKEAQEEEM